MLYIVTPGLLEVKGYTLVAIKSLLRISINIFNNDIYDLNNCHGYRTVFVGPAVELTVAGATITFNDNLDFEMNKYNHLWIIGYPKYNTSSWQDIFIPLPTIWHYIKKEATGNTARHIYMSYTNSTTISIGILYVNQLTQTSIHMYNHSSNATFFVNYIRIIH